MERATVHANVKERGVADDDLGNADVAPDWGILAGSQSGFGQEIALGVGSVNQVTRKLIVDCTRLLAGPTTPRTGIDRVDLLVTHHLVNFSPATTLGVDFILGLPSLVESAALQTCVERKMRQDEGGPGWQKSEAYAALTAWLSADGHRSSLDGTRLGGSQPAPSGHVAHFCQYIKRIGQPGYGLAARIPANSNYLCLVQPGMWAGALRGWLKRRPDIRAIFLVHDLLPLDYPEFFPKGYLKGFSRYFDMVAAHATAIVVSTEVVRARVERELALRTKRPIKLHVAPTPSTIGAHHTSGPVEEFNPAAPYFVVCGTVEPRKNHLLLLNVWKDLIRLGGQVPRLVIIGTRGWENQQVVAQLERSLHLRGHVAEVPWLCSAAFRQILARSSALLVPSFDEGYGLPLVEALALSVPVIASDIPVFHEVAHGSAGYLSPIDATGWRDAIASLVMRDSPLRHKLVMAARAFRGPAWEDYWASLYDFIGGLE